VPKRFWLPGGHATALAQQQLTELGWSPTDSVDWDLAWTLDPPEPAVLANAESGRWVNHYRGIDALIVKSHLCVTLREAAARATAAGAAALYDFAPETHLLPAEWDAWLKARTWDPDAVWIQKPAHLSRGRGIALVNDPREIANENLVVQRYVANPHLIDGFKYSLRFYVLIVSLDPLIAYLFDGGFTKFASRPFSLAGDDRADRFRHLTNPDVLREDPLAATVSGRNMTHHAYRARLRRDGIDDARLWSRIRRVLAATVGAAQPFMRAAERAHQGTGRGQFELLGIDITIDDTLKPWLLECNLSPSLSVEASAATEASREEADIKTRVISDSLRCAGVDEGPPPPTPANAGEARERLAWHDRRRGGFERLWPSTAALESLAGADLSALDCAVLEDEATHSPPTVVVSGVDTVPAGRQTVVVDAARSRITLLDAAESRSWSDRRGVEWLRLGWLAPADVIAANTAAPAGELAERPRNHWNREQVYRVHGLRVAISGAPPKLEASLDRALGWWDAREESIVDATLQVSRRSTVTDVLAELSALALRHRGGVVRRQCRIVGDGDRHVLVLTDAHDPRGAIATVVFGGSPCGAWLDRDGTLQPLALSAIVAARPEIGDVLLDLMSDGPAVVRVFDARAIRALASWLATVPIRSPREEI
jgi:hypothetical protein